MQLLERVVELNGRAFHAVVTLMQLEFNSGNAEKASAVVSRALGFSPGNPDLLMAEAELARARNHPDRARELAQLVLDREPNRVAAYTLLSDVAVASKNLTLAEQMIKEAAHRDADDVTIQLKMAAIRDARGDRSGAIAGLETFAKSDAGARNEPVMLAIAGLYCRDGQLDEFEKEIRAVEQFSPGSVRTARTRMRCLATRKRFDDLASALSERRADHPDDLVSMVLGANLLVSSGIDALRREALSFFEFVVRQAPTNLEGQLGIAQASFLLGDHAQTADAYRRVLAIDPNHNQAINDLAWILATDENDPSAAIELADRGVNRYPDDPHLLDTRGMILTKLDRLPEAAHDLELSVELADARDIPATQARALIHLADVFSKQDEQSMAYDRLEQAMALDQTHRILTDTERAKLNQDIERLKPA